MVKGASELVRRAFRANKKCMLPTGTFEGKVALVTGGGTGIGRAITSRLAELGASCCILSRKLDVLQKTADEINSTFPGSMVLPVAADVRDPEQVSAAISNCEARLGLPDIVVNNAAGNFISPTERLTPKAFKTVVDIVLLGTCNVTLDVGKRLIAAGRPGTFLAITTVYAHSGSGYVVPSAAAKAGVHTLHSSLAAEWGPKFGMRFNCIAPGPIYTKGAFSRLDPTGRLAEAAVGRLPARRLGELEEIANLAAYLVSDFSSWLTGEVVNLDGGELPAMSGEFNALEHIPDSQWDQLEAAIRSVKGS